MTHSKTFLAAALAIAAAAVGALFLSGVFDSKAQGNPVISIDMVTADNTAGQNISFVNLPIDQATLVHRDLVTASSIPPAAAGPQTAAFGATYIGTQGFAISPDTPLCTNVFALSMHSARSLQ